MPQLEEKFRTRLARLHAYRHALSVLNYDMETVMPPAGAEDMGETAGWLAEEQQRLLVDEEMGELLAAAEEAADLPEELRAEAAELTRQRAKLAVIPPEEYREWNALQSQAVSVWKQAKQDNAFEPFLPYLQKLIAYSIRFAQYYDDRRPVYDTLLDDNERGLTMADLDPFFQRIQQELTPLILEIPRQPAIEDGFLHQTFPIEAQRRLSDRLLALLTVDRRRCALGEVEHPFTDGVTNRDVRVTTHYFPEDMTSSMFSVLHEGGHALYMLNVDDKLNGLAVGDGASTAMHESQSRLFENMVGRSRAFLAFLLPELQALFPGLAGVTAEAFYRAVNQSRPSLIRINADELTYPLHILVRYRLEKALFSGDLDPADLPGAWDDLYEECLGLRPRDLSGGVLQDTHWACGLFGYFPGYALGSAYGAQLFHKAGQELDLEEDLGRGDLTPLCGWLRQRVWRLGALRQPQALLEAATGEAFDPGYYTRYLLEKYRDIYGL